jgi:AcrR family transcriptional regulator
MPDEDAESSLLEPNPRMHVDDRRRLLVDSAILEFALHGLDGTTTDAIARRAGISQPYVVRLFGTKKALFLAAVERSFDQVAEGLRTAAAAAPPGRRLQAMGDAYELERREQLCFQLQSYAASGDDEIRAVVSRRYGELWREVASLSGDGPQAIKAFFAISMLLTVAATIGVPELAERGEGWARDLLR